MLRYFLSLILLLFIFACAEEVVKEEGKIVVDSSLSFSELVSSGDSHYNNNPRSRDKVLASIEFYSLALSRTDDALKKSKLYWKISRSYSYLSKYAVSLANRSAHSELGISLAKKSLDIASSLEARYYYLLNRGLYAEANVLSAISMVEAMEMDALSLIDEGLLEMDYGGVYRFLAILYYKAPSFLLKGDKDQAILFFKKAYSVDPLYPPNLFYYASFLLEKGNKDKAMEHISSILKIESMREDFTNELEYWKGKARELQSKYHATNSS